MSCCDFIERFSDYFDGVGDGAFLEEAEAHLSSCGSCRRYAEVVRRGGELVRAAPAVSVREDFYPRLKHRIYHMEDARALSRGSAGSATTAATILGMAVLLSVVAWSPLMRSDRARFELSPIVVSFPSSSRSPGLRPPPVDLSSRGFAYGRFAPRSRALWERPHALLWEYSPLYERYGAFRQTALD